VLRSWKKSARWFAGARAASTASSSTAPSTESAHGTNGRRDPPMARTDRVASKTRQKRAGEDRSRSGTAAAASETPVPEPRVSEPLLRVLCFVADRYPFALAAVHPILEEWWPGAMPASLDQRHDLSRRLRQRLSAEWTSLTATFSGRAACLAYACRASRGPARDDPHAGDGQRAQAPLHVGGGPSRRSDFSGQGVSLAGPGSDLCRDDPSSARRGVSNRRPSRADCSIGPCPVGSIGASRACSFRAGGATHSILVCGGARSVLACGATHSILACGGASSIRRCRAARSDRSGERPAGLARGRRRADDP
jgi:hypothetical protein